MKKLPNNALCPECGLHVDTMRFVGDDRGIRRYKRHYHSLNNTTCPKSEKVIVEILEADKPVADLDALRTENQRLREALGKIVVLYGNLRDHRIPMTQGEYDMMDIARVALA